MNNEISREEIDVVMQKAWKAFLQYRNVSASDRATFLNKISDGLGEAEETLLELASRETNLSKPRLLIELNRTRFQLRNYGAIAAAGHWMDIRIDTANHERNPPKPDIRKMMIPLGPVAVFGASNFPFAYSTAGGDTASALAAGCPVIVKAHPAHLETSTRVAEIIWTTAAACNMPEGVFSHIHGTSFETGQDLVSHPNTRAVGFTGSFSGGKALFDLANKRPQPIPVFSEMSSINPVFLLPEKLSTDYEEVASMYANSITQSVGQFCTNPGLLIGIKSDALDKFATALGALIAKEHPAAMLHPGIAKAYHDKKKKALEQPNVRVVAAAQDEQLEIEGSAILTITSGKTFLANPVLHEEIFGPYSIIVECENIEQMTEVARRLEGQLTCTLMATAKDIQENDALVEMVKNICGRFIMNGVPTGVEVCLSMHHGGPYPATTDARFTAVGADAIKRFARPIAYQNWENELLPQELKNENPLNIWRTVNDELTRDIITA